MTGEGLEKETFESKSELGEGQRHVGIWEKIIPSRGVQGHDPEMRAHLLCSNYSWGRVWTPTALNPFHIVGMRSKK